MSRRKEYREPINRREGSLYLHGKDITDTPIVIYPDIPYYRTRLCAETEKRGERSWTLVDGKGKIVDKYRYIKPRDPSANLRPGYWAHQ